VTDAEIIADIKRSEGWPQYTDHPNDLGGPTRGGITLATFRIWRKDHTLTAADLRTLTEDEADAIYQFLYLQPFAAVTDEALRHYLIDLGVLRGPRKSVQMLQEIVGVEADGWIGPETVSAIGRYAKHLLVMLIGSRFTHIAARARENPTQKVFVNGWRNRNEKFLPA
jgi:lysozyme family protein